MNTRANPGYGSGEVCAVCLEKVFLGTNPTAQPKTCRHIIHKECYVKIIKAGGLRECAFFTCPTCRTKCTHNKMIFSDNQFPLPDNKGHENYEKLIKDYVIKHIVLRAAKIAGMDPTNTILKHIVRMYHTDFNF